MEEGRHIKILGKGAPELMRSVEQLKILLDDLVALLGMRCLGKPHMYEVAAEITKLGCEPFEDEGGVSGVVVLSTSHCAIHTWPLRSFFSLDIYSCRDFGNLEAVERLLQKRLNAFGLKITDLSFSLDYDALQPAEFEVPINLSPTPSLKL